MFFGYMNLNTWGFSLIFSYTPYKRSSEVHYCLIYINTGNAVKLCCSYVVLEEDHFKSSAFEVVAILSADSSSGSSKEEYVGLVRDLICPEGHHS